MSTMTPNSQYQITYETNVGGMSKRRNSMIQGIINTLNEKLDIEVRVLVRNICDDFVSDQYKADLISILKRETIDQFIDQNLTAIHYE